MKNTLILKDIIHKGFQLPLNPNLKNKEINLICNKIIDAIKI